MKKVLLLGDSIRMGYQDMVRDALQGEAEVYFDAQDNGRFAAYTLWQANQMLRNFGPFDVVHWNNGYWDMNVEAPMDEAMHPIAEYKHFLHRIAALCKASGALVIFATTLPIPGAGESADNTGTGAAISYNNDWVVKYNQAAREVMQAEGIAINDLYALCLRDENAYKCQDGLHLTQEGYLACAKQAANCIRAALNA